MIRTLLLSLLLVSSSFAHDVIGYLPGYRVNPQTLAAVNQCTDVAYFGNTLAADGSIVLGDNADQHLQKIRARIKQQTKAQKTRLILCLGGWANDKHFPAVTATASKRKNFALSLSKLTAKYQFDGVDLDWEYPKNNTQWLNLGKLVSEGKKALGKRPFIWSAAIASRHSIPAEVVNQLDRIHLMTYDAGKKHCHPAISKAAIADWKKRGVSVDKICIGAAFYGRNMKDRSDVKTYAQLLQAHGKAAQTTPTAGGYFYDDPAACKRKRQLVLDYKLRGIIVWEIGQDAPGKDALLPLLK